MIKKNRVYSHLAYNNQHKVIFFSQFFMIKPLATDLSIFYIIESIKNFTFAMRMCDLRAKNSNLILTEKQTIMYNMKTFKLN